MLTAIAPRGRGTTSGHCPNFSLGHVSQEFPKKPLPQFEPLDASSRNLMYLT